MNINQSKTNVYHLTYFPGSKVACLYFKGCNFCCLGCIRRICNFDIHLSSLGRKAQEKKIRVVLTIAQILNLLEEQKVDKVIFMGGEPTIDPSFGLITKKLKEEINSFNSLLTNAYILPDVSFLDEVCVGIKAKTAQLHREYTGNDSKRVFRNLRTLAKSSIFLRTECIFIPGYIDIKEIEFIARAVGQINPSIPLRIDAYIPVPGTPWRRPTEKEMEEGVSRAQKYLKKVTFIRGQRSSSLVKTLA